MWNAFLRTQQTYENIPDNTSQCIDLEDQLICVGYKKNRVKYFFFYLACVVLCGFPYLLHYWYDNFAAYVKCSKCYLSQADFILIKNCHGNYFLVPVQKCQCGLPGTGTVGQIRYFHHCHRKYVWNEEACVFVQLCGLDDGRSTLAQLVESAHGHTAQEQAQLLHLYDRNVIDVGVKSYWKLFLEEVLNPFYIFQVYSITLWCLDEYYYYAGCVFFLSAVSVITALVQTRKQSVALHNLATVHNASLVTVMRKNGVCEDVKADSLVPGDVIAIPQQGCQLTCDALLLTGNCVVNESMLTGESVPVIKTPPSLIQEVFDPVYHKRHTLFGGTHVIQTRFYGSEKVLALVVRTGFSTAKGGLIRSILYPKPLGFKFYKDSMKFVTFLFFIAIIGMGLCIYFNRHVDTKSLVLRTLDIVTIVVPPAMPAAMTVGIVYSLNRLKKRGIFCISPPRINVCGKVKVVCFDKTGTLTEEGLDLWGIVACENARFSSDVVTSPKDLPSSSQLVAAIATCHSLTFINGALSGDPLDILMFNSTGWELLEPAEDTHKFDQLAPTIVRPISRFPHEIGIIRQFPFSSSLQCLTVITRTLGSNYMTVHTKGSPEKISSICDPETVPANFDSTLETYTAAGYRVIAVAKRPLDSKLSWLQAQRIEREKVESGMTFLGLIIMQNSLKPETTPVINQLHRAKIRCLMVTGDNLHTAVSVGHKCGMILPYEQVVQVEAEPANGLAPPAIHFSVLGTTAYDTSLQNAKTHFAVDGKSWAVIYQHFCDLLPLLVTKGTIFARMGPEQKSQLVEALQDLDYIVAMCGDGANDCGALKAADVGISLSEAEASVAAPFTSTISNITCVLHIILEGRCALVTSFGVFKYMALYSLIQFITVLLLYMRSSMLGDFQFLYIDLVITTTLAVVMGRTGPASQLVARRPLGSLVSAVNMVPLLLQVLLTAAVQVSALYLLGSQAWFRPAKFHDDDDGVDETVIKCWENTSLFCVSCYQYLILAVVYSKGRPFRKPFYTNIFLLLSLLVLTCFNTLLLIYPIAPISNIFELMPASEDKPILMFRLWLFGLPVLHLFVATFIEVFIADTKWLKSVVHFVSRKRMPKNRYKLVDQRSLSDIQAMWQTS
ncbi:polyamine-transporting ATPase 13A3-like isoform X2 [Bacillus rossius redtenbacheri]|uniref:polyamine-transporting ATPase 13A3-like isoform X2 n=1 Tax=Bacillus rossius redtenbacheri TaxID=93214 RepID=UPI002FDD0054